MKTATEKLITDYIEKNISQFHQKRLDRVKKLKLKTILKRKNPYLFKSKAIFTASELVKSIVDAHLSSQEETIFGEFLEGLAIYINTIELSGQKSSTEGIDLEFIRDNVRYLVAIKSGPNWGNSSQIKRMESNFKTASKILKTNATKSKVVFVNGCCYGKENIPDKGLYLKLCGQEFWAFISGDEELYLKIIEPLGHKAKQKNDEFIDAYSTLLNQMTLDFGNDFCVKGRIDWNKLVEFVSRADK